MKKIIVLLCITLVGIFSTVNNINACSYREPTPNERLLQEVNFFKKTDIIIIGKALKKSTNTDQYKTKKTSKEIVLELVKVIKGEYNNTLFQTYLSTNYILGGPCNNTLDKNIINEGDVFLLYIKEKGGKYSITKKVNYYSIEIAKNEALIIKKQSKVIYKSYLQYLVSNKIKSFTLAPLFILVIILGFVIGLLIHLFLFIRKKDKRSKKYIYIIITYLIIIITLYYINNTYILN